MADFYLASGTAVAAHLGHRLSLEEACRAYRERYGVAEADLYHVLRALTWFEDAERDPAYPAGLTESMWGDIRAFFVREAPSLLAARLG